MDRLITIKDTQIELWATAIQTVLKELQLKIIENKRILEELEEQYRENEIILQDLRIETDFNSLFDHTTLTPPYIVRPSSANGIDSKNGNAYTINGSWWHKIQYILKSEERPLTASQIIELVYKHEPELLSASKTALEKVKINVYATLSNKTKEKLLKKEKKGGEKQSKYTLV